MVTYFACDVEAIELVRHESIVSFLLNKDHLRGYCNVIFVPISGFLPLRGLLRILAVNFVKFEKVYLSFQRV